MEPKNIIEIKNKKAEYQYFLMDSYTAGLVLTGIVVSVSVTAVLLSLVVRLNEEFHTLDIDEIIHILRQRDREDLK